MARGKWLTTGVVAGVALVAGVMIGFQVRLLDPHRAHRPRLRQA
jgi:uncharacterized membrane-anchored protein YhcB (DUF1043 family)